jgi:PPE-repeat protein
MDFALIPPEVNSGLMYAGAGSGPMLAAAAAWDGLATELHTAATSYGSVISELTAGPWLGAASAAMRSAVEPYLAWIRTTATQAEQTAIQARAAAAAYEVTFAAMVPPPVIAANRTLLQALVATNLFGQNSPAIAATEALYAEMWVQDATAMYGYAGASASATTFAPFSPAPQTTSGASPTAGAQAAVSQATSTALQGLASTAATNAVPAAVVDTLASIEGNLLFLPSVAQAGLTPLNTASLFVDMQYDDSELKEEETRDLAEKEANDILNTLRDNGFRMRENVGVEAGFMRPAMASGPTGPAVMAGLGRAPMIGGLSVPPAWSVAAPEIRLAALTLPASSLGAAPEVMATSPGSIFSEMTLANIAARAISSTSTPGRHQERVGSLCRARPTQMTESTSGHMTAMAASVQELAEALLKLGDLRDSGLLTDDEFSKEKERLLAH